LRKIKTRPLRERNKKKRGYSVGAIKEGKRLKKSKKNQKLGTSITTGEHMRTDEYLARNKRKK